jgi:hypothetical protein
MPETRGKEMNKMGVEGVKVTVLDEVRRQRATSESARRKNSTNVRSLRTVEDSISLEEALKIARKIINTYGNGKVLLQMFLKRHKDKKFGPGHLHASLERQKGLIAQCATSELKDIMRMHKEKPDHFSEEYLFAVAEAFVKRFPS